MAFPGFSYKVDELHLEMATTAFSEVSLIEAIAKRMDVAIGIVDVKGYFIESAEEVAEKVKLCLNYASADRLVFAPDCGLSQTARWAAQKKLANMVAGVRSVRETL